MASRLRRFGARALVLCAVLIALFVVVEVPRGAGPVHAQSAQRRFHVFLDAGHGNGDGGASFRFEDGAVLREADAALSVAIKTADLLRARGFAVTLSREREYRDGHGDDANRDGRTNYRDDLQDVVDMANAAGADLFLSLHHNGAGNAEAAGVEVYYCADRAFAQANRRLAELVQANLLQGLRDVGYEAQDRGVKEDSWLYPRRRGHLFVLGPATSRGKLRATQMPGILGEALFVSNPAEARILASEEGRWAIARGYAHAVATYFDSLEYLE